jgi:hypothetical protein
MSNNLSPLKGRTPAKAVVKRHLPEYIRDDYPTFVAFVEAYYEYLQSQGVDYTSIRDVDLTLEQFIDQFKKELAYNLPTITQDQRFLLQHIKEQYLAKGSEASYKLLFKLLYSKDVELIYPGRSMLIASDGRWNQEISVFARVDFGNPDDVVGKLVDIQTSERLVRVVIDRLQDIAGDVDRIALIDPNRQIFEFFLDRKFIGNISPNDKIIFNDQFQATILPSTQKLTITQPGKNFRIGQVFELRSGTGTGTLIKVTAITPAGGIKYAEIIKFGIGYNAEFSVSVATSNAVNSIPVIRASGSSTVIQQDTYSSLGDGTISADPQSLTVIGSSTNFGETDGPSVGDEIWTDELTPKFIGIVKTVNSLTSLTLVNIPSDYPTSITQVYDGTFSFRNTRSIGSIYNEGGVDSKTFKSTLGDRTSGFDEQGYINTADWVDSTYVNATYVGTVIREFSFSSANAQSDSDELAILTLSLGAVSKYPGYFETNNGFLDDSIFIQDSRYYQAFSYVVKIDERLSSYSSAVKTLLHPAGMALFGEFNVTNNYDLGVSLQSLINSLGISLQSFQNVSDLSTLNFTKGITTNINTPLDNNFRFTVVKVLTEPVQIQQEIGKQLRTRKDEIVGISEEFTIGARLNRDFNETLVITDPIGIKLDKENFLENIIFADSAEVSLVSERKPFDDVTTSDQDINFDYIKRLTADSRIIDEISIDIGSDRRFSTEYSGIIDSITSITGDYARPFEDTQSIISTSVTRRTDKYVTSLLNPSETGYVGLNPYAGQDYFAAEYSVDSRKSTFTTP